MTGSRSFGQTLTGLGPIQEALVSFVARVGEKLRRQSLTAAQVMGFVTTNRFSATRPFYANSTTVTLPYPTDFTADLVEAAVQLLNTLRAASHKPHAASICAGVEILAWHARTSNSS